MTAFTPIPSIGQADSSREKQLWGGGVGARLCDTSAGLGSLGQGQESSRSSQEEALVGGREMATDHEANMFSSCSISPCPLP